MRLEAWSLPRSQAPRLRALHVRRIVADYPFSNAGRLLRTFALDGDVPGDLDRAAADLIKTAGDDARADPGSGRHRRHEADLVEAVVDRHPQPAELNRVAQKAAQQRQRQEAVGDGRLERRLLRRARGVDVDPLPIAGRLGKL